MRILHVCDSIIGGTGSYLAELLPSQAALYGAENVKLVMPYQQRSYVEPRLREAGVELVYFSRPNRLRGLLALFRNYPRTRQRVSPDIVHAHSFGAGLVTRTLHRRNGPSVIFCPHGWSIDMHLPPFAIACLTKLERMLARRAHRIVLISRHERDRAIQIGIDPSMLVTVPNGIAELPPVGDPASWIDARLKLLFVGRLDRQKGLDVLLEAIGPLADTMALRVVGTAVLSSATNDRGDKRAVEYCGWMDRDGVVAQMKACDVLVVPSRWEGFGLVAIEAMRLGIPVVASDVGGLREILGQGLYGINVPPNDPQALRAALSALDVDRLRALGEQGRERFKACYTAERMVKNIDTVYRDVLLRETAATSRRISDVDRS